MLFRKPKKVRRKAKSKSTPKKEVKKSKPKKKPKSFEKASTIEDYYSFERKKIHKNLVQLEIEKTKAYIKIIERDYIHVRQKSQRLEDMHSELIKHLSALNRKISALRAKRQERAEVSQHLRAFATKVRKIEGTAKDVEKQRGLLLRKERNIITKLHKIISTPEAVLSPELKKYKPQFNAIENTKAYILSEAQHLLSKESKTLEANLHTMDLITEKMRNQIQRINTQLNSLSRKKRSYLWRKELLEFSEEKIDKQLAALKKKYRALEAKLLKLLPKQKTKNIRLTSEKSSSTKVKVTSAESTTKS